jgi:branched-chain amino acid transport system substrate-binding protein
VLQNLKLSRVAILRDIRNSYSTQIADRFAADFKNMGGVIVADQKYNEGDQDFTAELVTIRSLSLERS